jgi:hypothetical protein
MFCLISDLKSLGKKKPAKDFNNIKIKIKDLIKPNLT